MSLHYLVKYECQKTVCNLKAQDSTGKHLSCDGIFQCEFIIQFAHEIFLKICEHMAKSHAIIVKNLTV